MRLTLMMMFALFAFSVNARADGDIPISKLKDFSHKITEDESDREGSTFRVTLLGDQFRLKETFKYPKGDTTNFVFHNGKFFKSWPIFEKNTPHPPEDSCLITEAFTYDEDGKRTEHTVLPKGTELWVGDASDWKEEDGVRGAFIRFYHKGFQISCWGTKDKAPTVADLNRHFGGIFDLVSRKGPPKSKVEGEASIKRVESTGDAKKPARGGPKAPQAK